MAERDGAHLGRRGPCGQRPQGVAGLAGGDSTAIPTVTAKAPVESWYVARRTVVQCCRASAARAFGLIAAAHEAAGAMPIRVAVSRAGTALSSAVAGTWYGMTAGKIRPAGQVRQRLPISQAASCCCWPRLNVRGSTCSMTDPADTLSPISASTKPARTSR